MRTLRRLLDAMTLRRVIAALLIGAFAKQIVAFLSWSARIGRELGDVAALRALAAATLWLALEAGLIYLALRGLAWVLGRPREGGRDGDDSDHR